MTLKSVAAIDHVRDLSRMSTTLASKSGTAHPWRRGVQKVAILAAKLLVTSGCFWYISRQIDWRQVLSAIPLLDFRWAALATLLVMLEIPLLGLRWRNIVDALSARNIQVTGIDITAATAVGMFFGQVLPSVAGDGMRAWLLVRLGSDWRNAVVSTVIDRGIGLTVLIPLDFSFCCCRPASLHSGDIATWCSPYMAHSCSPE
jgi:uncharacterized membrane protein YbhN (UPF0104 family)